MKEKKSETKKMLMNISLIVLWMGFFSWFYPTYNKINYSVYMFFDLGNNLLAKAITAIENYPREVTIVLACVLILGSITLLNYLFVQQDNYFEERTSKSKINKMLSVGILAITATLLSFTILFPLLMFVYLIIVFIGYMLSIIVKNEKNDRYEVGDLIKEATGFSAAEEALEFVNDFISEWSAFFYEQDFELDYEILERSPNNYSIEVFLIKN